MDSYIIDKISEYVKQDVYCCFFDHENNILSEYLINNFGMTYNYDKNYKYNDNNGLFTLKFFVSAGSSDEAKTNVINQIKQKYLGKMTKKANSSMVFFYNNCEYLNENDVLGIVSNCLCARLYNIDESIEKFKGL